MKKKIIILCIFILILVITLIIYSKLNKNEKNLKTQIKEKEEIIYSSNIIKNVSYSSKDAKGNEYIIYASEGEIDYNQPNTIYLTKVKALIKLIKSSDIQIVSDFGKYNTDNFDTIFSKNIIINYTENKIEGEYLDFSIKRNSMIISRNVVYSNLKNILKADIIEIDIDTKNTKISMYEENNRVNIKSKE